MVVGLKELTAKTWKQFGGCLTVQLCHLHSDISIYLGDPLGGDPCPQSLPKLGDISLTRSLPVFFSMGLEARVIYILLLILELK